MCDFISLQQLALEDRAFDLGFARRYERLRQSIETVGILQPLLVRAIPGRSGHQVVCGFGRARVARDLLLQQVPVRILPPETSDADCLRLALWDNLPHRALNPIERAIALDRLGAHVGRGRLIADYMPAIGLPPNGAMLDRTLAPLRLIEPLQRAVADGRVEEKSGVALARFSADDQEAFARLIERCRPSVSIAREWAEALGDVARRDRCGLRDVLADPEIASPLDSETLSAGERCAAVRRAIHRRRVPALSAREEQFEQARSALHLPPAMSLQPAANFESDEMRLEVRFRSADELRRAASLIQSWLDNPSLLAELRKPL